MTDIKAMQRGRGVYIVTHGCNSVMFGQDIVHHYQTIYFPNLKAVRYYIDGLLKAGWDKREFLVRYFNTGLVVSQNCGAPHYNVVELDIDKIME